MLIVSWWPWCLGGRKSANLATETPKSTEMLIGVILCFSHRDHYVKCFGGKKIRKLSHGITETPKSTGKFFGEILCFSHRDHYVRSFGGRKVRKLSHRTTETPKSTEMSFGVILCFSHRDHYVRSFGVKKLSGFCRLQMIKTNFYHFCSKAQSHYCRALLLNCQTAISKLRSLFFVLHKERDHTHLLVPWIFPLVLA